MNDQVSLATSVQEKLDNDSEFHASIADLTEAEQEEKIAEKRSELMETLFVETHGRAAKAEEVAENQKKRAEKAEAEAKGKKPEDGAGGEGGAPTTAADADLSATDLYALWEQKIPSEDVEDVKKAAKLLGKSIPDTLKDDMVKTMLATKAEHRASANAANTRVQRGSAGKVSDSEILERAKRGEIPEPGSPEAEALYRARRGIQD